MKLGTCLYEGESYVFIDVGTHLLLPGLDENDQEMAWFDMGILIADYEELKPKLERIIDLDNPALEIDYADVTYQAPHPHPNQNVMCLGLNYLEHAQESAQAFNKTGKAPQYPIIFTKAVSSITGHNATIPFDPDTCSELDWEVELAVIIGKQGRKITREQAYDYVFGYTVLNDLSARDIQRNHKQFFLGKSFDGACPMGPYIVTKDEIPNPHDLTISCRVNGIIKQEANTGLMIFDIPAIIETISRSQTLYPGDIIATGTPSGVGFARNPPEFLKPNDVVECEIGGIGVLKNQIGLSA
ncbi:MAG: fumarylacetoacetate hydrolase family protein [Thiofilum sp.]|uniref:fumarylacetoacetate hydrolase family protein n=1 Tax=Thiofilum sp. TaxID=2212733 RepID=UPI0025FDCE00|nr:fumarylacetoacetate hydrolase family protein [Thiofilum sp.]MBK8452602.1 fumarylacetoacetate hydrolase family protein [Thiofilum sp.]